MFADAPIEVEITGSASADRCAVTLRGLDYDEWDSRLQQTLPSDEYAFYSEDRETMRYVFAPLEGKDAACSVPKGNVNALYGEEGMEYCNGELIDTLLYEVAK